VAETILRVLGNLELEMKVDLRGNTVNGRKRAQRTQRFSGSDIWGHTSIIDKWVRWEVAETILRVLKSLELEMKMGS